MEASFQPARKAHPGFVTAEIDALVARLEAAGIVPDWDEALADRRRFFIADPFGNRLEFIAYTAQA